MKLSRLDLQTIEIPFHQSFKHSSAERSTTESIWVTAELSSGHQGFGEGCPRSYVTGESLQTANEFFTTISPELIHTIAGLDDLKNWIRAHQSDIDRNPAAWCAIELSILDGLAKDAGQSIEAFLGLPELTGSFRYSAVIGDSGLEAFQKQFLKYRSFGFTDFKVKLSGDIQKDRTRCGWLKTQISDNLEFRCDANNLWENPDSACSYFKNINFPFWAIEEPLIEKNYHEMMSISQSLNVKIILDESLTREGQLSALDNSSDHYIVNLRVSKMGGIIRSLSLIDAANKQSLPIIVGAQVGETSLLTRAALPLARYCQELLVAQEGAFGSFLLQQDVSQPSLMFGKNGTLDIQAFPFRASYGFGLSIPQGLPFLKRLD
jgi:L-Ala-D/L-Glu epimerase / N-acetyl-D-glutamate racemase